jgi:hypothetical protein
MEWLIAVITGVIVQEGIKEVTQVTNGGTRMLGGLPVEVVLDSEYFGVVITPLDTHLMSAIIGLYFGGSLVKR